MELSGGSWGSGRPVVGTWRGETPWGRVAKRAVKCGRTGRFRQVRWTFGRAVGRCPRPVSDLAPTVSAGGESLGDGVLPALDSAPVGLMAALGEDRELAVGEVRGGEG